MSRAEQAGIEAADWLIAHEDGELSAAEQARFEAWMAASEGNKAAYWRLECAWEAADRVRALGPGAAMPEQKFDDASSRRWRIPSMIAASLALLAAAWMLVPKLPALAPGHADASQVTAASFATSVGMKQLVELVDGSRIQLNTQSAARAQISPQRREVWVEKGEVFFDVAHRRGQPFVVHAGDRQITVLGTKFSVRRHGDKVVVSVLEGRVRVDELKDNRLLRSSVIVGGKIAMAQGPATLVTERSDEKVADALSWRSGMLTFDQMPLPAIAAEFNRYNVRKLVLAGQSIESVEISGTFPSDQPDAFARLLRDAYGFDVEEAAGEIRVSN